MRSQPLIHGEFPACAGTEGMSVQQLGVSVMSIAELLPEKIGVTPVWAAAWEHVDVWRLYTIDLTLTG